ncbi:uncharacterized protein LOC142240168 [Haematobia irritans]|uniref:uncharacterized protein LOC142240168 n=1 Tax=Haematobia irritans TaxID=7368 RepID=UPI003F50B9EC
MVISTRYYTHQLTEEENDAELLGQVTRCVFENIPKDRRNIKVIFILKAENIVHGTSKDFRPISLSCFLLKTTERIVNDHIRNQLSICQHPYLKGKSVNCALNFVVDHIEKSVTYGDYILAAVLVLENSFNNTRIDRVVQTLEENGVDDFIRKWIDVILLHRNIEVELANSIRKAKTTRAIPQGGLTSSLLSLLIVNEVLIGL